MKPNYFLHMLLIVGTTGLSPAQTRVSNHKYLEFSKYHNAVSATSRKFYTDAEEIKIDPNTKVRPLRPVHARGTQGLTSEVVGTTQYDLQTNNSVCRRLINHGNGKLTATWTRGINPTGFDERGTGYNFFDGVSWGTDPTSRIENDRCGWPEPIRTRSNNELIISHHASFSKFGLNSAKRIFSGTGAWTNSWITQFSDTGATWPRIANTGDTIHIISSRLGSKFNNVPGGLAYLRSYNAGLSFTGPIVLPGMDTTNYNSFGIGGDAYSMDARGNTVAIVAGDFNTILYKSTDAGQTWTTKTIQSLSNLLYSGKSGETLEGVEQVTDGSFSVVIDSNEMAHVFFGKYQISDKDTAQGFTYYQTDLGIMYWNENMSAPQIINSTRVKDDDGDGIISYRLDSIYPNNVTEKLYGTRMVSMPSAAIGPDGTIYCVYSSIVENTNSTGDDNGELYRNLYAIASHNGGKTWAYPIHITKEEFTGDEYKMIEAVFGSLAKKVDDKLHILYQRDDIPGVAVLKLLETTPLDYAHDFVDNEIRYVTVPVCKFKAQITERDTFLCLGETLQLHASGGSTYEWSHPEFLDNPNIANPVVTFGNNIPIDFDNYFTVTVTDSGGCVSKAEILISPIIAQTISDTAICRGESVTLFTLTSSGDFLWSPDSTLNNLINPVVKPDSTTTYILTVKKEGCIDSDTATVIVSDTPSADFTTDKLVYTTQDTAIITNNSSGEDLSCLWNFGDGTSSNSCNSQLTHNFKNSGVYKITLTVTSQPAGCTQSFVLNITIKLPVSEKEQIQDKKLLLVQNIPNPFSEETVFSWKLLEDKNINFYLTDPVGKKVMIINNSHYPGGTNHLTISRITLNLNPGIYFYHISTGDETLIGKMIVQ